MVAISIVSLRSPFFLFSSLIFGAIFFAMAAQRAKRNSKTLMLVPKRTVAILLWVSAAACLCQGATISATQRPARYADYTVEGGNSLLQIIAANSSFFTIASTTVLFFSALASAIAVSLKKKPSHAKSIASS